MIPITEYAGKDVAVYGLGRTGLSAAKALKAGGARVHAWDDNEESRAKAEAAGIALSDINKRDWQTFAALVLSPGIPYKFPQPHRLVRMAEMTGVPVIGDMELFARAVQALPERARPKIVAITGTNGKSTTTALIGHILKQAGRDARVGGNIGTGVLDLAPLHSNAIYVLEMSSYQLDLVKSLRCDVAVFMNLSPDHLDRHGGMDGYQAAKMRIFQNQTEKDVAVIGFDDVYSQSIAIGLSAKGPQKVVQISSTYTLGKGISAVDGRLYDNQSGKAEFVGKLDECPALIGRHNYQNAAAAYAACRALGLDPGTIMAGLRSFPGLAHRMEAVGEIGGIRFINDSKATNAQAAEQALRAFKNIYWIAGGVPKAEGIAPLAPLFPNITKAYLIGQAEDAFAATLHGKVPSQVCGALDRAVEAAYRDAKAAGEPGAVILLSPACASFDQFKDYEQRGDAFRSLVQGMMPASLKVTA
ncbi:UDP-N-acetylmuramoyl-L-alanyl-D-glutamate synthetase [Hyphomonas polymorpha PS728]|uniref:UDP-N-acetylmuramoylalanine--D-glutamate ligase n=1 Tax=Hyphomonas polymorpha PS728 TaxID=1280954 RepID=A0A062V699_9PROT|nr:MULTISPECIES: UDP-N-acetylmuramoyl-L-alanine--D-glutamate ligase [Hyphomonas]AXE65437.1 UDP-N-acetylmuramoyl-L-alanine--D-glutamate ligase [Hyphomonas sp. CACIAM 19H1]KCZ97569.1 UDP-N-acetylmuramoyl-L-alanyl-D-glutamate synthetase [Hyphomonas polymorpha PS728]